MANLIFAFPLIFNCCAKLKSTDFAIAEKSHKMDRSGLVQEFHFNFGSGWVIYSMGQVIRSVQ